MPLTHPTIEYHNVITELLDALVFKWIIVNLTKKQG